MLASHAQEIVARTEEAAASALDAMGETAVQLVRAQMESGYGRAIRRTGGLIRDVQYAREGSRVLVGNTLPYAARISGGTAHLAARPYLTDGIRGGIEALASAAARALRASMER